MLQVDHADRILTRHEARALARIEDQRVARPLVSMSMRMSVKHKIEFGVLAREVVLRIVDDENASAGPFESAGRVDEVHAEAGRLAGESFALGQIVVPKDAEQGNLECGEALQDFRLGDVARVNDSFNRSGAKDLNDAVDVGQLIMSVSYDADSHRLILTHSGSPLFGPLCWRSADQSRLR